MRKIWSVMVAAGLALTLAGPVAAASVGTAPGQNKIVCFDGGGDYQPATLFALSAAAMWLSDAWFGFITFRLGVLNRWSALALLIGSLAAFTGMGYFGLAPNGSVMEKVILTLMALHGLAWILLGVEVALRRRPAPPAATA